MFSLLYVSSATHLFSDAELVELLDQSREKNARLGITGMLLYKDGNFMQALEGPEGAVLELYSTIQDDARHHHVLELLRRQVEEREFASWSMGFQNLRDANLPETAGYSTFMNDPLTSSGFQSDPTRAQRLLRVFRDKM